MDTTGAPGLASPFPSATKAQPGTFAKLGWGLFYGLGFNFHRALGIIKPGLSVGLNPTTPRFRPRPEKSSGVATSSSPWGRYGEGNEDVVAPLRRPPEHKKGRAASADSDAPGLATSWLTQALRRRNQTPTPRMTAPASIRASTSGTGVIRKLS